MRLVQRSGTLWRVSEVDSAQSPGTRGDRCLVFDGETVVRRAWSYPTDWDSLDDDRLWALLDAPRPPLRPTPPSARAWQGSADHRAVVSATESTARVRAVVADLTARDEVGESITAERKARLHAARARHDEMHAAIGAYTERLRRTGLPPEHALSAVKAAIQEGLGGPTGCDEPGAEALLHDGVAWCIEAYYAA